MFDITDPSRMVEIELVDSAGNVELRHELSLEFDNRLIDYSIQGEEIWAYANYFDEQQSGPG